MHEFSKCNNITIEFYNKASIRFLFSHRSRISIFPLTLIIVEDVDNQFIPMLKSNHKIVNPYLFRDKLIEQINNAKELNLLPALPYHFEKSKLPYITKINTAQMPQLNYGFCFTYCIQLVAIAQDKCRESTKCNSLNSAIFITKKCSSIRMGLCLGCILQRISGLPTCIICSEHSLDEHTVLLLKHFKNLFSGQINKLE
jgi:hypothetical protein